MVYEIEPRIFVAFEVAPFQCVSDLDGLVSDVSSHKAGLIIMGKLLNTIKYLLKNTERENAYQPENCKPGNSACEAEASLRSATGIFEIQLGT